MFKIDLRYTLPKLGAKKYPDDLKKLILAQAKLAATAFVEAAWPVVRIDTGQARGTFLNVSRALGIAVSFSGGTPRPEKNPETGAKQTTYRLPSATQNYFQLTISLPYFLTENAQGKQAILLGQEAAINKFKELQLPHPLNPDIKVNMEII